MASFKSFSSQSLSKGGELYEALVGSSEQAWGVFYHPLYVGIRFELLAGVQSLAAKQEATVDFRSSCSNLGDAFSRGGVIYTAATKAGRTHEWGPLMHNAIYYVWAITSGCSSREASIDRAFALREATPGTTAFMYKADLDTLELVDLPNTLSDNNSRSNEAIQATEVLQNEMQPSPPPLSFAELRERRLANLGIATNSAAKSQPQSPDFSSSSSQQKTSPNDASVNEGIKIQPKDHTNLVVGTTVVLETQIEATDASIKVSYQWLFSPRPDENCASEVLSEAGLANRRHLRINTVGLAQEGVYWCVVHNQRKSSTDTECTETRRAVVSLSALDRFILQKIESHVDEFDVTLPSMRFLYDSPEKTSSLVPVALRATQVIDDTLNLTGTSDPVDLGVEFSGLSASDIRTKARDLSAQLPVEISTLLALKARAHLLVSVGASTLAAVDGTSSIDKHFHVEQSRRDAAAALKILPGDHDALHVHAEASERCGRLTDAIESLTMLWRLSSSTNCGTFVDGRPVWNDYASRLAILEEQREEERRIHRANASNKNNKKASHFGDFFYDRDSYTGEPFGSQRHDSTDDGRGGNYQRASAAPSTFPEPKFSKSTTSTSWRVMFAQQEEAWEIFCSKGVEKDGKASTIDSERIIPWPSESLEGFQYVGVDVRASCQQKKQAVKKMLLRWHPDKFTQKFSKRFVSSELRETCRTMALAVARRLNDLSEII